MADLPSATLSPEEALRLHQRLLDHDPTASADLAQAYLDPLTNWLRTHNLPRRIEEDLCIEAAGLAIATLSKTPCSYDPGRQVLEVYLRISAQGDLLNTLEPERRHSVGRKTLESVELSPDARKYLGKDDDPSLPLEIAEEVQRALDSIPASVWEGLTEMERPVFELMLQRERETEVYAEACGLTDLPREEQARIVKQLKDRLKKRLERAREGSDEPTS